MSIERKDLDLDELTTLTRQLRELEAKASHRQQQLLSRFTLVITMLASVIGGAISLSGLIQYLPVFNSTINKVWTTWGGLIIGSLIGLMAGYGSRAVSERRRAQKEIIQVAEELQKRQEALIDDLSKILRADQKKGEPRS